MESTSVPLHMDATATSHMGINIATLVFLFGAKEHRELSSHHATQSSALGATPNSPQRLRNSEQLHSDEHPSRSKKCSTHLRGFGCSTRFSRHSFRSSFGTQSEAKGSFLHRWHRNVPLSPLSPSHLLSVLLQSHKPLLGFKIAVLESSSGRRGHQHLGVGYKNDRV